MVGGVGSDHATPECRAKLILTENPDIIFTDLHSSLKKKKSKGEEKKSPATIYIISVRLPAASMERLSFLRAYFRGIRQGRGKIGDEDNVKAQIFSSLRRLPNPPQGKLLVRNIVNKGQQCAV